MVSCQMKIGIPIGKIKDNNEVNSSENVIFFSDFSQLRFVKIVSFIKDFN